MVETSESPAVATLSSTGIGGFSLGGVPAAAAPSSTASSDASTTTATTKGGAGGGGGSNFGALLASSSSLLSSVGRVVGAHGSGAGGGAYSTAASTVAAQPALRRSLRELGVAATALGLPSSSSISSYYGPADAIDRGDAAPMTGAGVIGGGGAGGARTTTTTETYGAEAAAHRLLAREGRGFDSAKLGRSVRDLEWGLARGGAAAALGVGGGMAAREAAGGRATYPTTPYGVRSGLRTPSVAADGGGPDGPARAGTGGGGVAASPHHPYPSSSSSAADLLLYGDARDVEQLLRRHHDASVRSILWNQRIQTELDAANLIERRLKSDWDAEREELLRSYAGRGGVGSAAGGAARSSSDVGAGGGALLDPFRPSAVVSGPPPSHETIRAHATVVRNYNVAARSREAGTAGPFDVDASSKADALFDALRAVASSELQRRQQQQPQQGEGGSGDEASETAGGVAYGHAFDLFRSVLLVRRSPSSSSGVSGGGTGAGSAAQENEGVIKSRALGALSHLCNQFRDHLIGRVRAAALSGGSAAEGSANGGGGGGGSSLARDAVAYADLTLGRRGDGGNLWAAAYYCLRCGDAAAAHETLSRVGADTRVVQLASFLADRQCGARCLFDDAHDSRRGAIPPGVRAAVVDLHHRAKTRPNMGEEGVGDDPHRAACLALLSLAEDLSSSGGDGVVQTIEDYLFSSLWIAVQAEDVPPSSSSSASSLPSTCAEGVARLGKLLRHWGPSHFEDKEEGNAIRQQHRSQPQHSSSGGWSYALPLLIAQQFGSALSHLANAGGGLGLLRAVHLGIALNVAGVRLIDAVSNGGSGGGERSDTMRSTEAQRHSREWDCLLPSLLASYASMLQPVDPVVALDYLVLVPDPEEREIPRAAPSGKRIGTLARKHRSSFRPYQVRRLVLETRAFELLAGRVSPDGSREGGALDVHFSTADASAILADAAGDALQSGNVGDAAELFAVAGRYGSLLSLLNRQLASLLVVQDQESGDKRDFWRNAALQFHAIHLAHGRTHVVEVLESEDNLPLGNTFQLLMNLMVFFDRCRDRQWEDAWSLLDSLQLLPQSESEMTRQVEVFHSLDTVVKQTFHHVVLGAMESLYQQHALLKTRIGSGGQGAVEQRLIELRGRARLLVTFAGLIHLNKSNDTNARLARMEAHII